MKNFTLLLIAVLITFTALSQSKSALLKLKKQNKEAYSDWPTEAFSKLNVDLIFSIADSHNLDVGLKNATAKIKLDSIVSENLKTGTQEWINDWKDEFSYDASMKLKESVEKEWDTITGKWEIIGKSALTYNAAGQITKMNIFSIDEKDGMLKNDVRMDYFYSSTGRVDSVYNYNLETGNTWELTNKSYYSYNASGKITQMVAWAFDEDEEEWLPMMKTKFVYDSNGKRTEYNMYYSFDDAELLFFQTLYTWNSSGKLISEKSSTLNILTSSFDKSDSIVYTYNAAGDQSKVVEYRWDKPKTAWVPEFQDEYIYGNLNFSDVVYPFFTYFFIYAINPDYYNFQKAMVEIHESEYKNDAFVLSHKSKYFYSGTTSVNNENLIHDEVRFYPNPASDKVTFTWNQSFETMSLRLYEMKGSKILEKEISSHEPVSLGHLDRGVYVYILMNGQNQIHTGKVVLQ